MKFCPACGSENKEETKFCQNCGHDFSKKVEAKPAGTKIVINKPTKPMSKKNKIIIGAVVALLVVLFGGYKIAENATSKEKQVASYIDVLASGDASQLAKAVVTHDPNFDVTEETMAPYAAYLSENPNYVNDVAMRLRGYDGYPSDEIYIEANGKKLFFFDNYDLIVNPIYMTVSTNEPETLLFVNEVEVAKSSEDSYEFEVGPYAPGKHTFSATAEINGFNFDANEEVAFLSNDSYYNDVYLPIYGVYVEIESNQDEADIYLDDQIVGQLMDGYAEVGPINWNEGMKLELGIDYPYGTLKSNSVHIDEYDNYYELDFSNGYSLQVLSDNLIQYFYQHVIDMSLSSSEPSEADKDELASYIVDGRDNPLFVETMAIVAENQADEDLRRLNFYYKLDDSNQTDLHEFEAKMEGTLIKYYSSSSGKEDYEGIVQSDLVFTTAEGEFSSPAELYKLKALNNRFVETEEAVETEETVDTNEA